MNEKDLMKQITKEVEGAEGAEDFEAKLEGDLQEVVEGAKNLEGDFSQAPESAQQNIIKEIRNKIPKGGKLKALFAGILMMLSSQGIKAETNGVSGEGIQKEISVDDSKQGTEDTYDATGDFEKGTPEKRALEKKIKFVGFEEKDGVIYRIVEEEHFYTQDVTQKDIEEDTSGNDKEAMAGLAAKGYLEKVSIEKELKKEVIFSREDLGKYFLLENDTSDSYWIEIDRYSEDGNWASIVLRFNNENLQSLTQTDIKKMAERVQREVSRKAGKKHVKVVIENTRTGTFVLN